MTDIQALRTQEYSTNLALLSQQMTPKLANYVVKQQATGAKAFRMLSQIDKTSASLRTTSAKPAMNIDINHDGRWVYPQVYDWGKVVDDIDLMQTNIQPQGAYVRSAVAALNRQDDDLFLAAFFGTAQSGETGATATSFTSGNSIAIAFGTIVQRMREAQRILLANDVDLDMEPVYMAVSPKEHDLLLAETTVTSGDYNNKLVLVEGKVKNFLGMNIVISNRLPLNGSGERRLPVWVPSGMGCGVWKEINGVIRKRPDLQGDPDYVEASMSKGYTRLEEAKCVEILATA